MLVIIVFLQQILTIHYIDKISNDVVIKFNKNQEIIKYNLLNL